MTPRRSTGWWPCPISDSFRTARRIRGRRGSSWVVRAGPQCGPPCTSARTSDPTTSSSCSFPTRPWLSLEALRRRWMADHGFGRARGETAEAVLADKGDRLPPLVHVHPEETVRAAIAMLRGVRGFPGAGRQGRAPARPGRSGGIGVRPLAARAHPAQPGGLRSSRGVRDGAVDTIGQSETVDRLLIGWRAPVPCSSSTAGIPSASSPDRMCCRSWTVVTARPPSDGPAFETRAIHARPAAGPLDRSGRHPDLQTSTFAQSSVGRTRPTSTAARAIRRGPPSKTVWPAWRVPPTGRLRQWSRRGGRGVPAAQSR